MSTTFWLPSDTTAAVSPVPSGADWGHINTVSRILNSARGVSALTGITYTPDAADHLTDENSMVAQFVSPILPPQTIPAQVIGLGIRSLETVATNNLFLAWKLYAVSVDGTTVLATLLALGRNATEFNTTANGSVSARTSTEAILATNFRLVLEVGSGGLPTASGSIDGHNSTLAFGETYVANGVVGGSVDASNSTGRLEFASSLSFNALPAVGDVDNGVGFGDPNSPSTGTLVLPTEAQVEAGVGFGAGGTEFEGELSGGAGSIVIIRR